MKASTRRHRRYRATAGRVLNKLNSLPGDGQRLTYLRKISPYVFEELLLSAFERQGLAVVRNASYSGDGGLDGGHHRRRVLAYPAKRYSRAVSPHMLRTSTGFSCSPAAVGCLSTRAVPEK